MPKPLNDCPRGTILLRCEDCETRYEYFNHEVNKDLPRCPSCDSDKFIYERSANFTTVFHSKLAMSRRGYAKYSGYYESLALGLRYKYKTNTISAADVRKAIGHRIEKLED